MNLDDKAQDRVDVDLAMYSAARTYKMLSDNLLEANDLTEEGEFPQFGHFLHVQTDDGEQWIECPQDLARFLVDHDAEPGYVFRIVGVSKRDGEWQYDCDPQEDVPAELHPTTDE